MKEIAMPKQEIAKILKNVNVSGMSIEKYQKKPEKFTKFPAITYRQIGDNIKRQFGEMIILNIPALTEETRRGYVKQAKEYAEDCKIVLRNIRQDANNDIKKLELPEDDIKGGQEDVQELINKYNKIVEEKLKEKEKDLMTI